MKQNKQKKFAIQPVAWSTYMDPDGAATGVSYAQYLRIQDLHALSDTLGRSLTLTDLSHLVVTKKVQQCGDCSVFFRHVAWARLDGTAMKFAQRYKDVAELVEHLVFEGNFYSQSHAGPEVHLHGAPFKYLHQNGEMKTAASHPSFSCAGARSRKEWVTRHGEKPGRMYGAPSSEVKFVYADWEQGSRELVVRTKPQHKTVAHESSVPKRIPLNRRPLDRKSPSRGITQIPLQGVVAQRSAKVAVG